MDKYTLLNKHFGHRQFRRGQEELIDAVLAGRDVLGVMPTGGGKSLCYQIPALLLPGITLVISPLISLMKDQVAALGRAGVEAAYLNSSLTPRQMELVYSRARQGRYKILYVAPERLEGGRFAELARAAGISLVAVDEAHCVSQWGQDFRPSYLKIAAFFGALPARPPVAAFTATATAQVREDIVRLLGLRDPLEIVTGFDRPNLFFDVLRPRHKLPALLELLRARRERSGIVYCATRNGVDSVWQALLDAGFSTARYHAGMEEDDRRRNQDDFQFDRRAVMVATNAFGMGIDKSNVSFVIHYNMPKSLEAYYQEAGRAGRDGAPADCILLFAPGDITTAKFLIQNSGGDGLPPEEQERVRQRDLRRLAAMAGYCRTTGCLRGYILDYFGQAHPASCGSCGTCRASHELRDITREAQMILSCAVRIRDKLGYHVGKGLLVGVLRGSRRQRLLDLGLDGLSTYGLMGRLSQEQVQAMAERLEELGYLRTDPDHGALLPTARASAVLFGGETVSMAVLAEAEAPQEPAKKRPSRAAAASQEEDGLFAVLRQVRTRLAQTENVPAYIVFSNATLLDMAEKAPGTMQALLEVSGVGEVKAARYGKAFLKAISDWQEGRSEA